jgi:hypothetical protein
MSLMHCTGKSPVNFSVVVPALWVVVVASIVSSRVEVNSNPAT